MSKVNRKREELLLKAQTLDHVKKLASVAVDQVANLANTLKAMQVQIQRTDEVVGDLVADLVAVAEREERNGS